MQCPPTTHPHTGACHAHSDGPLSGLPPPHLGWRSPPSQRRVQPQPAADHSSWRIYWGATGQGVCTTYVGEPRAGPAPRTVWRAQVGGLHLGRCPTKPTPKKLLRSWPGWSGRRPAPLEWGSGSRFPLERGGEWLEVGCLCPPGGAWAGQSGHSPGDLGAPGDLHALPCRCRASRAARGASRLKPRPRTAASGRPTRRAAEWGPHLTLHPLLPCWERPLTPGGLWWACGGS